MPNSGQLSSVLDLPKANQGDFTALIPLGGAFTETQIILSWTGPVRTIKFSSWHCTDHPQESHPAPKGVVQALLYGLSGQEQFSPKENVGNSCQPQAPSAFSPGSFLHGAHHGQGMGTGFPSLCNEKLLPPHKRSHISATQIEGHSAKWQ